MSAYQNEVGVSSPGGGYKVDRGGHFPQEAMDAGEFFYLRSWQGTGAVRARLPRPVSAAGASAGAGGGSTGTFFLCETPFFEGIAAADEGQGRTWPRSPAGAHGRR